MVGTIGKYAISIIIIMLGIYAVKLVATKYNVPILSKVSEGI